MKRDPKKLIFLAVIVAVFLFLMMGGTNRYRQVFHLRQGNPQGQVNRRKAAQAKQKSTETVPAEEKKPLPPGFHRLAGHWIGRSTLPDRGFCTMEFELHVTPDNGFSGNSSMACQPLFGVTKSADAMNNLIHVNRLSAIMAGEADAESIKLHGVQTIDETHIGCVMGGFRVTPFGDNQLAIQWDDSPCKGGQMIMQRPTR